MNSVTDRVMHNVETFINRPKHRNALGRDMAVSFLASGALHFLVGGSAALTVASYAATAVLITAVGRAVFAGIMDMKLGDVGYPIDLTQFAVIHLGSMLATSLILNINLMFAAGITLAADTAKFSQHEKVHIVPTVKIFVI